MPRSIRGALALRSPQQNLWADLAYNLKNAGRDISNCPVTPLQVAALIRTIDSGEISGKIAKTVFEEMFRSSEDPGPIIKRNCHIKIVLSDD